MAGILSCFIDAFSGRERKKCACSIFPGLEPELLQYNLNISDDKSYFCIVSEAKESFQSFSIYFYVSYFILIVFISLRSSLISLVF